MFAGYLATFMLHCKWKKLDGFSIKKAASLYAKDKSIKSC